MEETITYHTCSKCGEKKPLTSEYFYSDKRNKNGFRSHCKICCISYGKNRTEYQKQYRDKNRDKLKEHHYNYHKNRLENDILYSNKIHLRKTLLTNFKEMGWKKDSKTQEYLGCDWETFKEHIENQFTEGMSWDNRGEWHYDHYYPQSLAQTEEDMFIFNHYTNFQPLWAKDNLSKSNKVPDGFEEWYENMKEKVFNNVLVV